MTWLSLYKAVRLAARRYGSRLLKSWTSTALLHDALPTGDDLEVVDSPLGFGFQLQASSTSVFNTLRMTDNDMAGRFFKDLVALYLQVQAKRRALDEIAVRQRAADEKRKEEAERRGHVEAPSRPEVVQ